MIKQLYNQAVIAGKALRIVKRQLGNLERKQVSPLSSEYARQAERVNQFANSYQSCLRAFVVLASEEQNRLQDELDSITWMSNELKRFEDDEPHTESAD